MISRFSRLLSILTLFIMPLIATIPSVSAQGGTSDVAIVATENGQPVNDACFVIVNFSNEGCDANGDGQITFEDVPTGTYTLTQTRDLGPGRSVPDMTISVTGATDADGWERIYVAVSTSGGSSSVAAGGMVVGATTCDNQNSCWNEIGAVITVTTEDGDYLGSCTVEGDRNDMSHVAACAVTFSFQASGTLIVTEDIATISPGYAPEKNPIYVDSSQIGRASHDVVFHNRPASGGTSGGGSSDVAVVTTENGQPAYDACFVLVGFSNEGCDQNRDGKITFDDVPVGTYTLRQTADLGPGRSVPDTTINVTGRVDADGWERFPATIVGGSSAVGGKDISLITRDPKGGTLLTGACYVLVGYSNEGCDENGDGQVTFDDIPAGTYTVRQTQTPAGYPTPTDFPIVVDGMYPNVPVGYLVRQAADQNAPRTRNVSIVFVDSRQDTKVESSICVTFIGASNLGCDRDLIDGQIDFLDVPHGTFSTEFSTVPAGWRVMNSGVSRLTIDAGTGPKIVYVPLDVSGGGGTGATSDTGALAVVGGSDTGTTPNASSPTDAPASGVSVELILDTSDSMNERDQGTQSRLEVAKTVTTRLVTQTLPAGSTMALRTYAGCTSSLAIPMQPLDPEAASATINGLRATGKTPIGHSLRAAAGDLANVTGPKIIVLVTDGEETCGGDPRQAIAALVAQDISIQVNIVGFAIDDVALTSTFQEWARVGNGTYYQASNELELNQAVTTASQLSFDVIDQQGGVVASGTVGGDALSLPVGTYTVAVQTVPVTRYEGIVVRAQETTTIDLATGGTTGSGTGGQGQNSQVILPADSAQGASATTDDTWTASVQVVKCEAPANGGQDRTCEGAAGVVVNISLASGEFLGSCKTGDPVDTPWGFTLSHCTVDGMPFNAELVATQDASTIPAGYEPANLTSTFQVGEMYMGNGDGATFGFTNVRTDSGSSGGTFSNASGATLLMTFRACPEGFSPTTGDYFTDCTIPLDAPDAAFYYHGGDGQGGSNIMWLDRQYDGAYIFNAGPQTMNLELSGLAPVVRNAYEVFGADSGDGSTFTVNLVDGETREVFVFYYFA